MEILRAADTDNSGTINYTGKFEDNLILYRVFGGNHGPINVFKGAVS